MVQQGYGSPMARVLMNIHPPQQQQQQSMCECVWRRLLRGNNSGRRRHHGVFILFRRFGRHCVFVFGIS